MGSRVAHAHVFDFSMSGPGRAPGYIYSDISFSASCQSRSFAMLANRSSWSDC